MMAAASTKRERFIGISLNAEYGTRALLENTSSARPLRPWSHIGSRAGVVADPRERSDLRDKGASFSVS